MKRIPVSVDSDLLDAGMEEPWDHDPVYSRSSGSRGRVGRNMLLMVVLVATAILYGAVAPASSGFPGMDKGTKEKPDATVEVRVETAGADNTSPDRARPAATVKVEVEAKSKKGASSAAGKILPPPDKQIAPVKTEAIDEAGKVLGKKIETLGNRAARLLGQWVNASAFKGISWLKLGICLGMLLSVIILDKLFGRLIEWRLRRISEKEKRTSWRQVVLQALHGPVRLFIYVYGSYAALSPLFVHLEKPFGQSFLHHAAERAADIGGGLAVVWFAYGLVKLVDVRLGRKARALDGKVDDLAASILGKTLRFLVAAVGGMLIIQNLTGVEIGPLVASLGIGGLAIALAAKEPLANIFGTFTVLFDKPFKVGDWIRIDGEEGVVESVGYRSTRVRTWDGHLVSVPNQKVVTASVDNVSVSSFLRWHTTILLSHENSSNALDRAVRTIREALRSHPGMRSDRPPRVFVEGFTEWGVKVVIYAFHHPADYWSFRSFVHNACLEIKRRLEAEGIIFAFPARDVEEHIAEHAAMRENPWTGHGHSEYRPRAWPSAT